MRILVVGAGALGLLFAGILERHGGEVAVLTRRREAAEAIASMGVEVVSRYGAWTSWPECSNDVRIARDIDVALICVKSYDTAEVAVRISKYLPEDCLVVTVQNGYNNVATLVSIFSQHRVVAGYTMQASTLLGLNKVYHAYDGETALGGHPLTKTDYESIRGVAEEFSRHGLRSLVLEDIYPELVVKLVINSIINPLTAILGVRNGVLARLGSLAPLVEGLIREGSTFAEALGVQLSVEELRERVFDAMEATAENKSSMLQDVERGRMTEVEFINGAISEVLRATGRPAPLNAALTTLVKALGERGHTLGTAG